MLPLLASARQRAFTGWMTRHHTIVQRVSGVVLILVAVLALWAEYAAI